ncbi:MAG: hypothetical protein WA989_02440 [Henriciella sp.]
MPEVVPAFIWSEEIAYFAESLEKLVECAGTRSSQKLFVFGEGHLDWVQIWAVGRQIQKPAASVFEYLGGASILVGAEIVQDDHRSRLEFWGKLCLHVGGEGLADST